MANQRFIAANREPGVDVVELTFGISTVAWLCKGHQESKWRAGWTIKVVKPIGAPCDLCPSDRPRDTVDYVPTSPDSRLPTRAEIPEPQQPETWAARLARLSKEQKRTVA
jgi:hypothetical protein